MTNDIFLNIASDSFYFPAEFFFLVENFNISENYIISVELAHVLMVFSDLRCFTLQSNGI